MNPTNETPKESAPAPAGGGPGGVMDVRPPEKPQVQAPVSVEVPVDRSTVMHTEPVVAPVPEESVPPANIDDKSPGLSADLLAQATKEVEKKPQTPSELLAAKAAKKKNGAPKVAVLVAIVVALLLSAAAVFAYLKTKDNTPETPATVNQTNQPSAATSADIDEASKEVEDAINSNGSDKDLPESELSEQTLGL